MAVSRAGLIEEHNPSHLVRPFLSKDYRMHCGIHIHVSAPRREEFFSSWKQNRFNRGT